MDNAKDNFQRMLDLAEFGANRHNERRQVVFRMFISYMTLLVVISGLIMRHWKDDMLQSVGFMFVVSIFLLLLFYFYCGWLKKVYEALIFDVRRRDFFLKKAEILCYYLSKAWADHVNPCETVLLNLAGMSYEIKENRLFEKSKPDIEDYIENTLKAPCKPNVSKDKHFRFHLCGPAGLTILIIIALIIKFIMNWI